MRITCNELYLCIKLCLFCCKNCQEVHSRTTQFADRSVFWTYCYEQFGNAMLFYFSVDGYMSNVLWVFSDPFLYTSLYSLMVWWRHWNVFTSRYIVTILSIFCYTRFWIIWALEEEYLNYHRENWSILSLIFCYKFVLIIMVIVNVNYLFNTNIGFSILKIDRVYLYYFVVSFWIKQCWDGTFIQWNSFH